MAIYHYFATKDANLLLQSRITLKIGIFFKN